jgi:hypothetical protein
MIESKRSRGEPIRASVAKNVAANARNEGIQEGLISASSPQNKSN